MRIRPTVNGTARAFGVPAETNLLRLLRDHGRLRGTKNGCEEGSCGACSVLLDDELMYSCLVPAVAADGARVETVEGVAERWRDDPDAPRSPVQQAFVDCAAVQCGYCTPGMIMASVSLLRRNPDPSREEIRAGLAGNLCRCTGYLQIIEAVELAARRASAEVP